MKTTKHALFSQDQDQFIKWLDKYDAQAIKEAIVEHLGNNPDDTVEHCKEYGKGSVKNYYGHEIVNFYENNPKNGKPCKVYMKNGKEYLRALTLGLCLLLFCFAAQAQTKYTIFFPQVCEVTEVYSDETWIGAGEMKIKIWEDPARLKVSTPDSTYALTLYPSDQKKVSYVFAFKDADIHGNKFEGGELNPYLIPNEEQNNKGIILLLSLLLLIL